MDFWSLWRLRNISKLFSRMIVFATLLTTLVVGGVLIRNEIENYRHLAELQRERYISEQKISIRDIVLSEARYISLRKKSMEQAYVDELKFNVEQAYELATGLAGKLKGISDDKKKELLKALVTDLKSKNYFSKVFIGSTDGVGVYYPGHPEYENQVLLNHTDVHGNKVIESELQFLEKNDKGFLYYGLDDSLPDPNNLLKNKIVYLKKFGKWNWYFGGKIYMEDHLPVFTRDIAEKISSVRFRHSGYVFINKLDGTPIVLDGEVFKGDFNFHDGTDSVRLNVFKKQVAAAFSSDEGGYFSYNWNKIGELERTPKLSYVYYLKELDWMVGAGFYLNDIDGELEVQQSILRDNLQGSIAKIIFALIFVLLAEIVIIFFFDKNYKSDIKKFFLSLKDASEDYRKINMSEFYFDEFKRTALAVNSMIDAHEEIHKRLLSEQERATLSDKLKTAFLANMSHEIRTPMNAIVGFSDILSSSDLEPETKKEIFYYIKSSSNQLLKLIDDILDISKIESNQLKVVSRSFMLLPFLKHVEAETRQLIQTGKSTNVLLETVFAIDDQLVLSSDELRLRQVLLNLLTNAVKFTNEGKICLKVENEDGWLLFSVKDTGMGIPEEEHNLIFERFRQSEHVSTVRFGGTGLGLAISKNIVELLGGTIHLKSEYGKGSEFYFRIPLRG